MLAFVQNKTAQGVSGWIGIFSFIFGGLAKMTPAWFGALTVPQTALVGIAGSLILSLAVAVSLAVGAWGYRLLKPLPETTPASTSNNEEIVMPAALSVDDAHIQSVILGRIQHLVDFKTRYLPVVEKLELEQKREQAKVVVQQIAGRRIPKGARGKPWNFIDFEQPARALAIMGIPDAEIKVAQDEAENESRRLLRHAPIPADEQGTWQSAKEMEQWHATMARLDALLQIMKKRGWIDG